MADLLLPQRQDSTQPRRRPSVESYAHKAAKAVLISWLRGAAKKAGYDEYANLGDVSWRVNRSGPHWGVWAEYPVLPDGQTGSTLVWDECDDRFGNAPPTFKELIKSGTPPAVIIDVAVQHKGQISYAFEIFHKHPTSWEKRLFLEQECGIEVIELPTRWILGQVGVPREIPNTYRSDPL